LISGLRTKIMNKKQLQKEWDRIIKEVHDKPKCRTPYPKQVVLVRELLLLAQVILEKLEDKENVLFNSELYQKTITEYYRQKAWLKI